MVYNSRLSRKAIIDPSPSRADPLSSEILSSKSSLAYGPGRLNHYERNGLPNLVRGDRG